MESSNYWSLSLWWDPNDVQPLSSDEVVRWIVSAAQYTLLMTVLSQGWWWCCGWPVVAVYARTRSGPVTMTGLLHRIADKQSTITLPATRTVHCSLPSVYCLHLVLEWWLPLCIKANVRRKLCVVTESVLYWNKVEDWSSDRAEELIYYHRLRSSYYGFDTWVILSVGDAFVFFIDC